MTLAEFLEEERKEIDNFEKEWKSDNIKDPKNFPMKMAPGEWEQQMFNIKGSWC